ncbi:MAG TPA: MFS transporter [Anaerolineae bacterium]|nr:MFS transporter [Anaerolineae bacterium]
MNGPVTRYVRQLRSFSRNAQAYLLSVVITGVSFSIYQLIFNLFIVSQGYSRSFLGSLQSLPNLIALIGTIPAGVLVDHIGRKKSMVLAGVMRTVATLGIVVAPGPVWLQLSVIGFGIAQSLGMVSSAPFMMENSTQEERNTLFSANFGLQTLVGFVGTFVGGYLPTWFGGLFNAGVESPTAYAATLGVTVALSVVSILPLLAIQEVRRPEVKVRSIWPWNNISDTGLVVRIFVPNIIISMGAAILIPYMNLFFKQTFEIPDRTLGTIFSISSIVTGVATLASPLLAQRWGRIRALVITQLASIPFLLTIGFAPWFWVAAAGMWVRAALMNMGNPLYSAFAMEQVQERERATVSGLMGVSWNLGWTIGPFLSGYMQQNPNIGFKPIFVITCTTYVVAVLLERLFFQQVDDRQRRAAMLGAVGAVDLTPATPRRGWRL